VTSARIVVSRPRQVVGAFVAFTVAVDGSAMAKLGPGSTVELDGAPVVPHVVELRLRAHRASLPVNVPDGENVHLTADMDSDEFGDYVGAGVIRKVRMSRGLVKRARSQPGYLGLTRV
jgi:hypothetical protein